MTTYRQLVYTIFDECKIYSDDTVWETEHIVSMLNKYRALLFTQKYKGKKVDIPTSYYQRLNVTFTNVITGTKIYKSIKILPSILDITNIWQYTFVSKLGIASDNINFVNYSKFKMSGFNKWLTNQVYATIDVDKYMYLKKSDTTSPYNIMYDTILDNPIDADIFNGTNTMDVLDLEFPCEESLIQPIVDQCIKELGTLNQTISDNSNDASDDAQLQQQQQKQQ